MSLYMREGGAGASRTERALVAEQSHLIPQNAHAGYAVEGDLQKRSGHGDAGHSWSKRHFQLQEDEGRLVFWDKKAPQKTFFVETAHIYDVQLVGAPGSSSHHSALSHDDGGRDFRFSYTGGRVLYLRAASSADRDKWVLALRACAARTATSISANIVNTHLRGGVALAAAEQQRRSLSPGSSTRLPAGWQVAYDSSRQQHPYYFNRATNEKSWARPRESSTTPIYDGRRGDVVRKLAAQHYVEGGISGSRYGGSYEGTSMAIVRQLAEQHYLESAAAPAQPPSPGYSLSPQRGGSERNLVGSAPPRSRSGSPRSPRSPRIGALEVRFQIIGNART